MTLHGLYRKLLLATALLYMIFPLASVQAASKTAASSKNTTAGAPTQTEDISQAVTQSYNADSSVQQGMIVQLKKSAASTVEPLTTVTITSMLGVVVAANDSTVTLTPQTATQQQVYVATSGRYNVLVSNQNGTIQAGSYITISSVSGVGMMADQNQAIVLGKAVSGFNGTSNVQGTITLKDSTGHNHQVAIGKISVDLAIAHNPLQSKATDYVPSFLSKAAVTIASKPVSAARIYLGVLTLLVAAVVTANMLYSGVRSGMLAIGRNPLSKKSIIRSLIQTVIAGLIIFVVGVLGVYLLLKL